MTDVVLPKTSQTGAQEWSDVEDNDRAIRDVVNGDLDNANFDAAAAIAGSKLKAGGVTTSKLADALVTRAKVDPDSVRTKRVNFTADSGITFVEFLWVPRLPTNNFTAIVTPVGTSVSTVWFENLNVVGGTIFYGEATTGGTFHILAIHD